LQIHTEHIFKPNLWLQPGTDLSIGQIGNGLGLRAFRGPAHDLFYDDAMLTKICKTAQRHNLTICLETGRNANV